MVAPAFNHTQLHLTFILLSRSAVTSNWQKVWLAEFSSSSRGHGFAEPRLHPWTGCICPSSFFLCFSFIFPLMSYSLLKVRHHLLDSSNTCSQSLQLLRSTVKAIEFWCPTVQPDRWTGGSTDNSQRCPQFTDWVRVPEPTLSSLQAPATPAPRLSSISGLQVLQHIPHIIKNKL